MEDFQRILDIVDTLKTVAVQVTVVQNGRIPAGITRHAVHTTNIAMRNGVLMSGKLNFSS